MANILAVGVYLANKPNTAAHMIYELATSHDHKVVQRWIALAPGGHGRFDLPGTEKVVTEPGPKFSLLDTVIEDACEFDWLLVCDDDIEVGPNFLDSLIRFSEAFDFALFQPARTADSYIDHPIVQIMPGLKARRTRFVEIGPIFCIRRDAMPLLLPFGSEVGMGWGLDFIWPIKLERAGLRMGIIDAAPVAHRMRAPVSAYGYAEAHTAMHTLLERRANLPLEECFIVLEVFP